ncbi:MAG TPA: aspartate aminotransferase family protein [Candidatus Galloscillospira stercoripullorum]|nr:aspartate aminotransferase family protein [Candidatus Galloscillospira stercoripullorum]
MDHQQLKELDNTYFMPTYGRFDVDIDHGHGATLYDLSGKEYIDFSSGIGVNSIGCAHPRWVEAIAAQAAKLGHISNLFYTQPGARLAKIMCERSGMAGVFFSNSGAEANEGAIKLARKWSFDKYGKGRGTIITLKNSFHGRTAVTLKATGQEVFHNYFYPFPEGFRYAEAGDMASLEEVSGHDVCAVMLELVQGEGGVRPMEKAYVQALSALCEQRDWLLIIDEVQSGIGRTGTFFAYQQYGIVPDVVTFAKGVAGGLPMGGFLANEKCRGVLTAGTHGSTFGGNPVSAAAALAVMEVLSDETIAAVAEKGAYLRQKIAELGLSCLGDTRGLGLMIGVEVKGERSNKELAALLIQNGLLALTGGKDLRLLPPLTITREEMDKGLAIMAQVLR